MKVRISSYVLGGFLGAALYEIINKNTPLESVVNGVVQLVDKPLIKSHGMWFLAMVVVTFFAGIVVKMILGSAVKMVEKANRR